MKKSAALFTTLYAFSAFAGPEQESVRISGNLRSFSDQDWLSIAGERSSDRYEITRGDTLWDVSSRLFGDAKVWPKIWEINNTSILNPHMITPRMSIVFNSGSGLSLPTLSMGKAVNNASASTVKNHYRTNSDDRPGPVWDEKTPNPGSEWKRLPRQSWEHVDANLPPDIDRDGFDSNNRIYLRKTPTGLELPHLVACEPISPLGKVEGTRNSTNYVYRGSEITIAASSAGPLEIDRVYSLVDPQASNLENGDRKALSYDVLGKVKILGLHNGTYVGEVLQTREPVIRGAMLVPEILRVDKMGPVAGAKSVKGTILADRRTGNFMSGQHKWVYVDRGTRDGVDRGMMFRIFQNTDPKTQKPLTRGDVFVQGDVQIIQGCGDFSIGMFLWSRGEVPERYEGMLLTDVSDEKIRFYFNGQASDLEISDIPPAVMTQPSEIIDEPAPPQKEALIGPGPTENPESLSPEGLNPAPPTDQASGDGDDWLDKLDNNQELRGEEENELRELEKFKETQKAQAPPAPEFLPPPANEAELAPPAEFPSNEPELETL